MNVLVNEIVEILEQCTDFDSDVIRASIVKPPSIEMGDLGTKLSFQMAGGKSPAEIASSLAECANRSSKRKFLTAKAFGPYVNFFVTNETYYTKVLEGCKDAPAKPNGKRVIIETAPANIGEQFKLLHYRAMCIANLLAKVYRYLGYDVDVLLFWNDCGTPAGRLLYAYREWGDQIALNNNPLLEFRRLRSLFEESSAKHPELAEIARELSLGIEQGNEELIKTWRHLREIHLRALVHEYNRFNFSYDEITYESQNNEIVQKIKDAFLIQGIAQSGDDGSIIAKLDTHNLPIAILFRKDGASLYTVRDLAELIRRCQEGFDQNIYVVSRNQIMHFQQMFTLAGFIQEFDYESCRCIHVPFGLIHMGNFTLDEVIDISMQLVYAQVKYGESAEQKHALARIIGEAILKLHLLNRKTIADITFKEQELSSIGTTAGLYLLYSIVRANKLLRRCRMANLPRNLVVAPIGREEQDLIKALDRRQIVLEETIKQNEPYELVQYSLDLGAQFNQFYDSCPVASQGYIDERRLTIVDAFANVMNVLLGFIGIQCPEEM